MGCREIRDVGTNGEEKGQNAEKVLTITLGLILTDSSQLLTSALISTPWLTLKCHLEMTDSCDYLDISLKRPHDILGQTGLVLGF